METRGLCRRREEKGVGTRLGACSDSTLPPSTHTQMNSTVHTLITEMYSQYTALALQRTIMISLV